MVPGKQGIHDKNYQNVALCVDLRFVGHSSQKLQPVINHWKIAFLKFTLLSWAFINVMVSLGKPVAVKRNYFIKLLFVDLHQRCGHNQSNVRVEKLS